jgi:hypothetical protein
LELIPKLADGSLGIPQKQVAALRRKQSDYTSKAKIYLPQGQRIFPQIGDSGRYFGYSIPFGFKEENIFFGEFTTFDGKNKRKIMIDTTEGKVSFTSVLDGNPVGDLICDFASDGDQEFANVRSKSSGVRKKFSIPAWLRKR